jgi:hypothetical protein
MIKLLAYFALFENKFYILILVLAKYLLR